MARPYGLEARAFVDVWSWFGVVNLPRALRASPKSVLHDHATTRSLAISRQAFITSGQVIRRVHARLHEFTINPFIRISTFTRHIAKMVFDKRRGFLSDRFEVGALTSGPCS
jgi:hypothetical protein